MRVDAQRTIEPQLDLLLPAAAQALKIELRKPPGELRVIACEKREYSTTWELQCDSGHYILKWLPYRAARELELTRLCGQLFAGVPFIRTPRVACCPTPSTFLVEKLPGEPLHAVCTRPPWLGLSRWVETRRLLLSRVGAWLGDFHRSSLSFDTAPFTGLKAQVLKREAVFSTLDKGLVEKLLRSLDIAVTAARVRVHGDFTPHNILVSGDTIAVIDFAGITEFEHETPWYDVATMIVSLEEYWRSRLRNHLRYAPSLLHSMTAAFVKASGTPPDEAAFPLCYAVRHVTRIYYRFLQTGKPPGPRDWHVRRLRLALDRPESIRRLAG